ncbi:MAG TPA: hypothetical protein VLK85_34610 [Ramlibacter sp.]|nr:hypothetical protein [Ramlibacter sp.]
MSFDDRIEITAGGCGRDEADALALYVARQLESFFPRGGIDADAQRIAAALPRVLQRLEPILRAVKGFRTGTFQLFHSLQYATFLYLLANEQWNTGGDRGLPERLFLLNRALNAIDLYPAVELPEVFFISHGLGTVLGNVPYGNRLVFFQNVTVGRVGDARPVIGNNVVLYPGAVVSGRTVIGDHCVVAAGTVLHDVSVPDHSMARMEDGKLAIRPIARDYIGLYLSE